MSIKTDVDSLSPYDGNIVDYALELGETDNYLEGINLLLSLNKKYKNNSAINFFLAKIYRDHNDSVNAEKYYKRAVKLAPDSEFSSHALFHCLFENNKLKSAFKEMDRYLTNFEPKSKELFYITLLKELIEDNDKNDLGKYYDMIIKHYSKYCP